MKGGTFRYRLCYFFLDYVCSKINPFIRRLVLGESDKQCFRLRIGACAGILILLRRSRIAFLTFRQSRQVGSRC